MNGATLDSKFLGYGVLCVLLHTVKPESVGYRFRTSLQVPAECGICSVDIVNEP